MRTALVKLATKDFIARINAGAEFPDAEWEVMTLYFLTRKEKEAMLATYDKTMACFSARLT
jgi:hypothetical protein